MNASTGDLTGSPATTERAERLFARAIQAQQSGRIAEAAQCSEEVLAIDPDHAGALTFLASLALQARRPHAALELAQRATVADPESSEAWQFLGLAQRQRGRLGDAIVSLERSAAFGGDYFEAELNLGNALLEAGRVSDALGHYRRGLEIDPRSALALDYRLTDARIDPAGLTEDQHIEALWRLPATMWCYQPYADAPAVDPLPAQARGQVSFVNLNSPGKVTPGMLELWVGILSAVTDSRLVLLAPAHSGRRDELRRYFAARGVAPERLDLVERRPLRGYLELYNDADVALDTHPYAGGTTTCDALWMGVPVVTLAGSRPFSRTGASVLGSLGLGDMVAATPETYVRTAVALASDRGRLALLRAGLRERMRASPLTDAAHFTRDLEDAYGSMHERAAAAEQGGRQ